MRRALPGATFRTLALLLSVLTAAAVLSAVPSGPRALADTLPPAVGTPTTVSTDPLPAPQIDGVVWTQLVVGDVVYVGGEFTTARPAGAAPGTDTVPRANFLAYSLSTGTLLDSFAPAFNAAVRALAVSPDGGTLYVGGSFTTVNGTNRYRIAAFTLATGGLNPRFAAVANASVYGLAAVADRVYAVGVFSVMNNASRLNAAALGAADGAVLPFAVTPAGGTIRQVVVSPDPTRAKVVLGGSFTTMNGSSNPGYGLAAVDPDRGTLLPLPVNGLLRNGGPNAAIMSLAAAPEGFYGAGFAYSKAAGNLEGAFRADWDGNLTWLEDCHGDTYSVAVAGDAAYVAGHPHYCGGVGGFPEVSPRAFNRGLAFTREPRGVLGTDPQNYYNYEGRPAPALLDWYPEINAGTYTGQAQGPWSVAATEDYVLYGGEFTAVNGVPQQGLVRFARAGLAPDADGPRVGGAAAGLTAQAFADGTVRVSWPANWDRDNRQLSYRLFRDGTLVSDRTRESTFWSRPTMGFTDRNLTPGGTYSYRLRAADPYANTQWSDPVAVTVTGGGVPLGAYGSATLDDGAGTYWPLNDLTGGSTPSLVGTDHATVGTAVVRGVPGALVGEPTTGYRLTGSLASTVGGTAAVPGPDAYSAELWFRTSSPSGGALMGFDASATGGSATADRVVYLANDGRLFFAAKPNNLVRSVGTSARYNDGKWHHVVSTIGPDGLSLYLDGVRAGNLPTTKAGRAVKGYWRVGGTVLTGLPAKPTATYVSADVDEVAIHTAPLTAGQIAARYQRGITGLGPNTPPTAAYTATASPLRLDVDASAASDPDGSIAAYAWDFGDGSTGSGVRAGHDYAAAGTYPVSLVVTDDRGGQSTRLTKQVVVPAVPNARPTARLALGADGLAVAVDGSGSTDPDGTIAGYAWDYGDGATGSGSTDRHAYAAPGSYVVRLTVTDDDGDTASASQAITVPTGDAPLVLDEFNRSLSSGLGTADIGGTWTTSGASGFGVTDGSAVYKLSTAGTSRTAYLAGPQQTSADVRLAFASDQPATGGGTYLTVTGRRVSPTADYRASLRLTSTNKVTVTLQALRGTTTAEALAPTVTLPGNYVAGSDVQVRLQTVGTSPTTVRVKVWLDGEPEPADWTVSASDGFAALQTPGAVGFAAYLSGSATNAPVLISLRRIAATPVTN